MAFHVVSSFLLRVLASKTTLWMAGIFQQPIRCFCFMVFEANTRSKKEDTKWKAMKNWVRECYFFLCTINLEVTWPFWKMWFIIFCTGISVWKLSPTHSGHILSRCLDRLSFQTSSQSSAYGIIESILLQKSSLPGGTAVVVGKL